MRYIFTIPLLLTLVAVALQVCTARVLFRRPSAYGNFMRQVNINYEKAKVETLGDIFKRHVQQLRHTHNKQVELVFLIDSSGTVGRYYFYEEIRFVRNLLADFTVDVNTTRVSVITFSSPHKIYRHIDYLTKPDNDNHKCRLLNEDILHVDYTPGGTHTLGAFLEAEKVLKSARKNAAKAIFLMTDGYSNGGDPRPVARKLKREGVKIFTFGIRDGFVWELEDMASDPKNETCYILDSFEEFEALAKRALHADLQSGSYVEQTTSKCSEICTKEGLCCHDNATCSCGTYTGKYECLCKPGYYGTGRGKTGCKPCPPGTHKNFTGLGDSSICVQCPDEHQTTTAGATSVQQCVCKRGYRSFDNKECTVFRCPELSPPKFGYFVNNVCNNVFNAACGLRCQHGYELRGSSLRICQDDGTWSGQDGECIMKTCPSLPTPKNGHMICSSDDFSYSSVCRFTCNAGYQLVGSRKRNCLAIAYWTGIATRCREITCPPLVDIRDGTIMPTTCTLREVVFGSTCQISCSSGYVLKGPHTKQCTPDGTWMSTGDGINQCIDETPPVLDCPDNVEVEANEFEDTTEVVWTAPVSVDNSGFRPVLTSEPAVLPGSRFHIGVTYITYKAEDLSRNVAKCKFYIRVTDKTPPTVDKCVSPQPVVSKTELTPIVLQSPLFSDNSGKPVEVVSSHQSEELFPWGTTTVVYRAFDAANNNVTCAMDVVVVPHLCVIPKPPANGNISCEEGESGILCRVVCSDGFAFALSSAEEYFCDYEEGRWMPEKMFPIPDCAEVQFSNDLIQPATITLTGDNLCKDQLLIQRIQQDLEGKVGDKLSIVCENDISCSIGSLTSVCEEDEDFNKIQLVLENKRRRRSINLQSDTAKEKKSLARRKSKLTFEFKLEGSLKDPKQTEEGKSLQLSESLTKMLDNLQKEAGLGELDLTVGDQTLTFSGMYYDVDLQTYRCPNGSVLVNETCVSCPVGTFHHSGRDKCQECAKGTYQPSEGQDTCLQCSDKRSTARSHSKNEAECLALCSPGTFSANGLEPCETCQLGFFQPNYAADKCFSCSRKKTTQRRGAQTEANCTDICVPGFVSETGLAPCLPCPRDSYQPKYGQMECFQCPTDGATTHTGATSLDECIFSGETEGMLSDTETKKGGQRPVVFSPCFGEPCFNGGTCVSTKGAALFKCNCPKGFTGTLCENGLDMCEAKPCHNGGICITNVGGFQCDCLKGFTGTNCEINIDECASLPCLNRGTCVDGINSFTCNCPVGYTGRLCNSAVNDCADAPCRNGGTCSNTQTGFKCQCDVGFTGTVCEVDIDECMSAPCQNGANCKDMPGKYRCECTGGFSGANCQTEVDECFDNPCQNGAICEDQLNDYKCLCIAGFTGKKCEKELTSQYQLDFANPTTMDYAQLSIDNPMSSVTVSFWVRTTDRDHQGTPFSYAVHGEPNAFTLTDYNNLNLNINGEERAIGTSLTNGVWYHVVLTWSSARGDWKIYINGVIKDQGYNLSTAKPIPGKGIFIVGQEQDSFGGGFSSSETFFGTLTQLNVWDQELTLSDIDNLRYTCGNLVGNVIAWPNVQTAVKGNVGSSTSTFCLDCPTPVAPQFGTVIVTDTAPGAQIEYSCDVGYTMGGNPLLKCLVTGEWDELPPGCVVTNCGPPGNVRNGYVIGQDFSFNKTIRIQCHTGYELDGSSTMYCNEFGEWEEDKPNCVAIQCSLPTISQNTISDSNKKKFPPGSVVKFTCQPGSVMQTVHSSVTCQRDGSWDRSVPSCDLQKCGSPPAIDNGEPWISNPQNNVGETVSYECDTGYEFNPNVPKVRRSITCQQSGEWDSELPVCGPIRCPDPPYIANAAAVGEGRTYLAVVNYTCLPGFEPVGKGVIKCEDKKDWSSLTFRCVPLDCGKPADISHGSINGDMNRFNSIVTYQCTTGYTLMGDQARRCEENGKWSGPDPSCQPVSCGNAAEIANGQVVYRYTTYLSTAQYLCDPGFSLQGSSEIICEASGFWVPELPSCEPRACPQPTDIDFGSFSASGRFVFNAVLEYTCNTGYQLKGEEKLTCLQDGTWSSTAPTCDPTKCPLLESPQNGNVAVIGQTFSSNARYTCNDGFRLHGVDARTCQADGTWNAEAPTCLSIYCVEPELPDNGRHDYKNLSIGSIVRYFCDKGYLLEGDSVRRCLDDLNLSGEKPTCRPVSCGSAGELSNGAVSLSDRGTVFEAVATYACNNGYGLKGVATRTCGADGKWTGQKPECILMECSKVTNFISNGRTNSTDSSFGSSVLYTCDPGYVLDGSPVRKCKSDGIWDKPIPSCEAVECPPPRLAHGLVSTFQRSYGTVVKFSCNNNYRLIGPSERTCMQSGQWSNDEPECSKIKCEPPADVANSKTTVVNDTALRYECHEGYNMVGEPVRVCGKGQVWRPDAPVCQAVACEDLALATIDNGNVVYTSNVYKDFVSYTCNPGYTLIGLENRQCLSDGQWDGNAPMCNIVSCGHPGLLFNGQVAQGDYTVDSTVEFSCKRGYKLVGGNSLLCKSDGLWEGTFPSCEKIFCPELSPTIPNGMVTVSTRTVSSEAEYKCASGFHLIGEQYRECLNTGQWSGKEPFCADVSCIPPPPVEHGVMEGEKFGFGDAIFYTCGEGHYLLGDFTRVCQQDGSWSNNPPNCVPVTCPEPNWVDNGEFEGDSADYLSVMTFSCVEGYEVTGSSIRVCQANGTWSGQEPDCQRISCGSPPVIANAVLDQMENFLFEDRVVYTCIDGYTEHGLDTADCLSNTSWSFIDYTCTIVSCPSLSIEDIPHGRFDIASFTYGSNLSFTCDEGYLLSGSSHTFCTAQGAWTAGLPTCQIVQCNQLSAFTNGKVLSISNNFGSLASFVCDVGYRLVGSEAIECLSSGQWNESQPVCQIVSCVAPPSLISDGHLNDPRLEYFYTDTCSYSCDFGYELSGLNLLTCLETGYFDLPPPSCVKIPCPPPDEIEYGTVTLVNEDRAVYECVEGFELEGLSTLDCLLGGSWSGLAPLCRPVVCPNPLPVTNGWVEGSEFTFGQSITYKCDPGYNLDKTDIRVCLSNQLWSNEEPRCVPISCGKPLEEFENGIITGQFVFGERIEYTCLQGFELKGVSYRHCQADGAWSGISPACMRLSCPAPNDIMHGTISGQSYLFEDSVTYNCVEGYELQGVALRICESSLTWSGTDPACERISCAVPTTPLNGFLIGSSYLFGDQINLSCNIGYRLTGSEQRVCEANGLWSGAETFCEQLFCPLPSVITGTTNNATAGLDLYPVYSVVVYECGIGHIMTGTGTRVCEPSGAWSADIIECHPVSCQRVESIEHGLVVGDSYTYLSILEFTCNSGFNLVGNSTLQCTESGTWNSAIPYCSVVVCPIFSIENGYFILQISEASSIAIPRVSGIHIYGDVITFECNQGFEVEGELKSQCQLDGAWSVTSTTCVPVKCQKPAGIEHAVFAESPLTFGSTLQVSCLDGYDLIGESELTCGADRNWEETLPRCELLVCGSPPAVQNAVIEGASFRQGDTISYKCKGGYELVGNSLLTCGDANVWLGSPPSCMEVDCGPPPVLPASTVTVGKTTFRSIAELKCNSGYFVKGNATIVCTADRTWKYEEGLLCAPVDCGQPPSLDNSFFSVNTTTLGSVAVYSCNKGYFMGAASSLICDEDGTWVYEYPACYPVDCSQPPDVDHATKLSSGTVYLSVVDYNCVEGYSHRYTNQTSLLCGDMATWQGEMPVCDIVECGLPPDIQNAFYLLDNNKTDYRSNAIYYCKTGYLTEENDLYFVCSASGHWEGNGFNCQPVECSDNPSIPNAENYQINEAKFESLAYFSCSKGFVRTGPDYVVCQENGQWSSNEHACLPLECEEPEDPKYGSVDYNATTYTSTVVYSCLPGYNIVGEAVSVCLDSGKWSAAAPSCTVVDCLIPPVIHNGTALYAGTTYQNLAVYSCYPGYTLNSSNTLICGEAATWLGETPSCTAVFCKEPEKHDHSQVVFSSLTYQSVAIFSCEPGYRLAGESLLTCGQNGSWSAESPRCSLLDCSHLNQINHGEVSMSGTTFGSLATYTCNKGFLLEGSSIISCNADGSWSSSPPTCTIANCREPPKIANGVSVFNATTYLSVVSYKCVEGYQLSETRVMTCGENGEWDAAEKPGCTIITCPEPTLIENGVVSFLELSYGSAAYYSCEAGYSLVGSFVIQCQSDGTWDKSPPLCRQPSCPALSDIPNGFFKINGSQVGADANFSCSTGFFVEGESRLVCLSNQSWSSEPPVCKRVSCAPPPVIAKAMITADTGRNVSSKVTYSCIRGYRMVNDIDNEITITCGLDGDWFGKIPSCEIVVCYDLPPEIPHSTYITNGDTYTSEAKYTCDPGYTQSGNRIIICDHTGQWSSDDPPSCLPISCGTPLKYDKSSYEETDFTFSQSVNYICEPGHDLIGTSTSICQLGGKWSPVVFTCQVRHCNPVIPVPENGKIVSRADKGTYIVGSTVQFACQEEFTLIGSSTIRCSESGEWDSSPPQCLYIIDLCSESLQMDNVLPPPPGKVTGNTITVQCQKGYLPIGNMTSLCRSDSTWSLPEGRCQKVSCGKPKVKDAQNTVVIGRNFYYGDTVMVMCRYGYVPAQPQAFLTCLETGEWDGRPECIAQCKQECLNGGFCIGLNRCKCMPGWAGDRCQTAVCILPCLHGGSCIAPYKCGCPPGYQGTRCQEALCGRQCENGGRCLRPNRCQCPYGVHGAFCDKLRAEHNLIT